MGGWRETAFSPAAAPRRGSLLFHVPAAGWAGVRCGDRAGGAESHGPGESHLMGGACRPPLWSADTRSDHPGRQAPGAGGWGGAWPAACPTALLPACTSPPRAGRSSPTCWSSRALCASGHLSPQKETDKQGSGRPEPPRQALRGLPPRATNPVSCHPNLTVGCQERRGFENECPVHTSHLPAGNRAQSTGLCPLRQRPIRRETRGRPGPSCRRPPAPPQASPFPVRGALGARNAALTAFRRV